MSKPIRKRAFDFHEFKGPSGPVLHAVDAYTNEAEAWLRGQLAEYARIEPACLYHPPGRIYFALQGFDIEDVETYLCEQWAEHAPAWPEEVAESEEAR